MIHILLLAGVGLGHAYLFVSAVNVLHGSGFRARLMEWAIHAIPLAVVVGTVPMGLWLALHPWNDWPAVVRAYALVCLASSGLVLPAVTLQRTLRGPVAGVTGRSSEIDLAARFGVETLIGAHPRSWMLRLPGNDAFRLRREEWRVAIDGLPPSLEGLSLVHLSDLHFSKCYDERFFEAVADEVSRWEADLMLFTGDLIDDDACIPWIEPFFSRLGGRLGRFAILGNHDYRHQAQAARHALARAGFNDLDGRWTRLTVEGASLALGGTSSPWGPSLDPLAMPKADLRLVLSHTPDLLPHVASWGVDLMFSGHNHGGQVRLPVLGPLLMPSRHGRRFDQGFFRQRSTLLYVGRGIGSEHPIRYGAPPEITRMILVPARTRAWSRSARPHALRLPTHRQVVVPA